MITHCGRRGVSCGVPGAVDEDGEEEAVGHDGQEHVGIHSVHVFQLAFGLKVNKGLYRVTHDVVLKVVLTSKLKLRFKIGSSV